MLEVNNLRITVNSKVLVDNISFKLDENKTLGIIGQSGSGKTLTVLSIMGLLDRKIYKISGNIKFLNKEILGLNEKEIALIRLSEIAMVYQNPFNTFSPVEKINKQLDRIYKIKKLKRDDIKIKYLLEKVSLSESYLKKYPHEMSGGELQRMVIVTALLLKPEIIIFDEPTTSLDINTGRSIIKLLKKLKKEEKFSIIFISHDLNMIEDISDELIVMKNGKIVEKGKALEVINNPKDEYSRKLLKLFKLGD
jgi:ABC transporter, ATP-binding protein